MSKFILSCSLLLLSNCGDGRTNKAYLPKMEFKKVPNSKYDKYFPDERDTKINSNAEQKESVKQVQSEPIPSFNETNLNIIETNNKSEGFFSFLFKDNNKIQDNNDQDVCSELLDINKNILIDQNKKLIVLNNKNVELVSKVKEMDQEIKKIQGYKSAEQRTLQQEINRLNKLIKILSTEIK